jgi:hypothetical protein
MKEVALKQLAVGMTAMMRVGSPVRQWMRKIRDGTRWLTPVHYTPLPDDPLEPEAGPQLVEVEIGKIMLPYATVYHDNGRGWVKLWIDTREVRLYSPCQ